MDATVRGGNLFGAMMAVRAPDSSEPTAVERPSSSAPPAEEEEPAGTWGEDIYAGDDGEIAMLTEELSKGASIAPQSADPAVETAVEAMRVTALHAHVRNQGGITKKAAGSRTISSRSSSSSRSTASGTSSQREHRSAYLQRVHLAHVTRRPCATMRAVTPPAEHTEPLLPPLLPQLAPPVFDTSPPVIDAPHG